MPTTKKTHNYFHQGTLEDWRVGVENMAALGSKFVAIYGAEPLTRQELLPEVITHIYNVGMKATVITALPRHPFLIELLERSPLDSVSCSYDFITSDPDRQKKSSHGWEFLLNHPNIKDRSVIATVTPENIEHIPRMAQEANDNGFWFLFDLIHGAHSLGSKCSGAPTSFPKEQVQNMAAQLLELKKAGKKIHASEQYLSFLAGVSTGVVRQMWHCGGYDVGWLTVNADGRIFPCDDMQIGYKRRIWDELNRDELASWYKGTVADCEGCSWNTHFDACNISSGLIEIGSYVHQ